MGLRMKVFIENQNKTKSLKFTGNILQLLKKLKINPEEVVVACNNNIVTNDYELSDSDDIKILSVVSGG
jgi:thiamine biosynthesis protein ThiS